jgi:hypothetical protein
VRQYRLRGAMTLVAVVAFSIALGSYFERARQGAARAGKGAAPKVAPGPVSPAKAFNFHVGAFW